MNFVISFWSKYDQDLVVTTQLPEAEDRGSEGGDWSLRKAVLVPNFCCHLARPELREQTEVCYQKDLSPDPVTPDVQSLAPA